MKKIGRRQRTCAGLGVRRCNGSEGTSMDVRGMLRARRTTCAISNARARKMLVLNRFMDQTSTPWTSFQAPRAARPENATIPITAWMSMPVKTGHCLLMTASITKDSPSRR